MNKKICLVYWNNITTTISFNLGQPIPGSLLSLLQYLGIQKKKHEIPTLIFFYKCLSYNSKMI